MMTLISEEKCMMLAQATNRRWDVAYRRERFELKPPARMCILCAMARQLRGFT